MYFYTIVPVGNVKINHTIKYSYEGNTMIKVSLLKYSIDIDYTELNFPVLFTDILFQYGWNKESINILERIILQPPSKWQKSMNVDISQ